MSQVPTCNVASISPSYECMFIHDIAHYVTTLWPVERRKQMMKINNQ